MAVDIMMADGPETLAAQQMAQVFGIKSKHSGNQLAKPAEVAELVMWVFDPVEAQTKEKTSYYWTHRQTILDRERKVSRVTVHLCSCGKAIAPYHNAKKHADLMGHKLVGKRQDKIQREEKVKEQANRIDVRISMGMLGLTRAESKENWQ